MMIIAIRMVITATTKATQAKRKSSKSQILTVSPPLPPSPHRSERAPGLQHLRRRREGPVQHQLQRHHLHEGAPGSRRPELLQPGGEGVRHGHPAVRPAVLDRAGRSRSLPRWVVLVLSCSAGLFAGAVLLF